MHRTASAWHNALKIEISGHSIGIALTTNGLCIPLLRFIANEWLRLEAKLVVATNGEMWDAVRVLPITIATADVSPVTMETRCRKHVIGSKVPMF
jgi:hypothetical protein